MKTFLNFSKFMMWNFLKQNKRKIFISSAFGLIISNNIYNSFSYYAAKAKPQFVSSAENVGFTIYSKESNEPLSSGFFVSKDGKFVTILNIFSLDQNNNDSINSDLYCAKLWNGSSTYPIKIDFILKEENLAFGHILATEENIEFSISDFQNNEIQEVGRKVYLFSKSAKNLNLIERGFILDSGYNGIDMLINIKSQDLVCFGSPLMSKEGKIMGILQPTNSEQYDQNLLMTGGKSFKNICNQYLQTGMVKRSYLGLSVKFSNEQNLTVVKINSGGPANLSGIKLGDVITEINGKKIENMNDFMRRVSYIKNEKIIFKILRNGVPIDCEVITD